MTYDDYIKASSLPPVEPLTPDKKDSDEQFFIRTHQVFEIWFDQIIAELTYSHAKVAGNRILTSDIRMVSRSVSRAAEIFRLLNEHLRLLETIGTKSFYGFRQQLFGASAGQSYRFRKIELLMGQTDRELKVYLLEKNMMDGRRADDGQERGLGSKLSFDGVCPVAPRTENGDSSQSVPQTKATERLENDLPNEASLRQVVFDWLSRMRYPDPDASLASSEEYAGVFIERFKTRYLQAYETELAILRNNGTAGRHEVEGLYAQAQTRLDWFLSNPTRRALLFVLQFGDQPVLAPTASLLESLLSLDAALGAWRTMHLKMVCQILGDGRISTVGQQRSGIDYLARTLQRRAFPEIWDARSFILSDRECSGLYSGQPGEQDKWPNFRFPSEEPGKALQKEA